MKVIFEKYTNDYNRKSETKTFTSLTELENWIFGQMQQDYSRNRYAMWFPLPESVKKYKRDGPGSIEFRPCYGGEDIWIHQIESNDGIIFSDGRFTSGQKHWTIDVQNWLVHCEQRRKNPKFNFAYENSKQKPQPEPQQITNWRNSKLHPPTEQDGDGIGSVLTVEYHSNIRSGIWIVNKMTWSIVADNPEKYPLWMPMPELPKGVECENRPR